MSVPASIYQFMHDRSLYIFLSIHSFVQISICLCMQLTSFVQELGKFLLSNQEMGLLLTFYLFYFLFSFYQLLWCHFVGDLISSCVRHSLFVTLLMRFKTESVFSKQPCYFQTKLDIYGHFSINTCICTF